MTRYYHKELPKFEDDVDIDDLFDMVFGITEISEDGSLVEL